MQNKPSNDKGQNHSGTGATKDKGLSETEIDKEMQGAENVFSEELLKARQNP